MPVVCPGKPIGQARVVLRGALRVELDAHAAVGLARHRYGDVDAVLHPAYEPGCRLCRRYVDAGILRATHRRAPGPIEIVTAIVVAGVGFVDDATGQDAAGAGDQDERQRFYRGGYAITAHFGQLSAIGARNRRTAARMQRNTHAREYITGPSGW